MGTGKIQNLDSVRLINFIEQIEIKIECLILFQTDSITRF